MKEAFKTFSGFSYEIQTPLCKLDIYWIISKMAANAYFDEEGYELLFVDISRCHRPRIGKDI